MRPIEAFVRRIDALFSAAAPALASLSVVGGSAVGVELAMALARRLRRTYRIDRAFIARYLRAGEPG